MAAFELGSIDDLLPQKLDFLVNGLLDTGQPISHRFRALFSLRNLKGRRPREALVQAMNDSSSNLLAHEAAFALGQMQDEDAIPCLRAVLEDHARYHPIVRHEAAEALGAIGKTECLDLLKKALVLDPALEVRETCELALQRIEQGIRVMKSSGAAEEVDASPFLSVDPVAPAPSSTGMRTASSSDSTKNTCRDFCALRRMAAAAAQGRVRVGADRVDVAPLCKISSGYNKSGRVWITRAANEEAGHYSFTGDPVADAQVQERLRRELRDTGMLTFPRNTEKEDHTQARIFKMAANRGDILAVEDMEMEDPCAAEISGEEDCKVEAELGLEEKEIESDRLDLDSSKTSLEGNIEDMEESDVYARFGIRNGREVYQERAYLVGVELKSGNRNLFGIHDSLKELAQLADTAGLKVVGSTYQRLEHPSPKTYISSGKVVEVQTAVRALNVETVIFDDEISPGQLRNLEKTLGKQVRVCDRTALILDIFSQRAATREATLQVDLAQTDYQLPRLTQMWSHLERQAGGMVKGMGEKQIEVDKRILRSRIASLKRELESVRSHRQQYRDRRAAVPIPVISLVGYTNAGKSTLLNKLSGADVLAEDRLFATLDPITKRVELPNGKVCLFTDTVGFIQKLPTQLVAAFRATLEEISDSSLILHVVDISHPMAEQQIKAVEGVLDELEVEHIPSLCIWNKVDKARDPAIMKAEAKRRSNVVCISALTGEGMQDFYDAIESKLKDLLVWIEAVVPYQKGDLVDTIHRLGIVEEEEYMNTGTLVKAHVPLGLSKQLLHLRQPVLSKC